MRTLAPHTEAQPEALLLQLLAAFGNVIGPGPHCMVGSTRHALNLFVVLVGESSKARKGTSWNHIARLFAEVDPAWTENRVTSARLSARGLVAVMGHQAGDRRLLALAESLRRTEAHNGFANRCLWACVQRSQCLPDGGNVNAEQQSAVCFIDACKSNVPLLVSFARHPTNALYQGTTSVGPMEFSTFFRLCPGCL